MGSGALVTLYFEVTSTSGGTALRFGPETRLNDGTVPVVTENGSVSPGTTAYEVSPSGSIDFGVLTTGESATRTLTVRNTGNATLEGHAEVTGQSFSLVSAPSFTLAPNATTMVTVRFAPGANGDFTGALRLSGATSAEIQVTLKGSAARQQDSRVCPGRRRPRFEPGRPCHAGCNGIGPRLLHAPQANRVAVSKDSTASPHLLRYSRSAWGLASFFACFPRHHNHPQADNGADSSLRFSNALAFPTWV